MLIYTITIVITIFFAYYQKKVKGKRAKKLFFALTLLPPTLVAAFRFDRITDYVMYSQMFKVIGSGGTLTSFRTKTIETGFYWLVKICQGITAESWFTFGVIALIIYYLFFKTCLENSENYVLSIVLFFFTAVYFDSFNGLRQYLAMAIFFYGFKYIEQKDLKRYILVCLIAFLFHKSIIFVAPIYFLQFLKFDLKKALLIIVLSVAFGSVIYKVVLWGLSYTPYSYLLASQELNEAVTNTNQIIFFSMNTIISFYVLKKKTIKNNKTNILYNIQTVGTAITLLTMFIPLASRVSGYFMIYEMLFIPYYLTMITKKKTRQLVCFAVLMVYFVINVYGICFRGWYGCYPYQTIFSAM